MNHSRRARFFAALVCAGGLAAAAVMLAQPAPFTTEEIFEAAGVREGRTVCEMGAGDGELTIAAARAVGPGGRVYSSELGEERLASLRKRVAAAELPQITVIEGDPAATNFPDGTCDALFMRNVYHHFADPAAMTASIWKAVAPGGRVVVVDFRPRNGVEAERPADRAGGPAHGVTPESVARELTAAGFTHATTAPSDEPRVFMVVLARPE